MNRFARRLLCAAAYGMMLLVVTAVWAEEPAGPRGFAVLGAHGPGEWGDMDIPEGWTHDREGDGLRITGVVNTIMPPVTEADRKRGYLAFGHNYCDQVLPESTPLPQQLNRPVTLSAAPGEYEPASVCVRALREIKGLRVTVSAIRKGKDTIPASHIDLRVVRYMPRPLDAAKKTYAIRPVYLERRERIVLAADMTAQYWLTVNIPVGQPAGLYSGGIEFSGDNVSSSALELTVEVLPFELEDPPTVFSMFHLMSSNNKHSYHHLPNALEIQATDMAAHGMNGVITYGAPYVEARGKDLHVDFEQLAGEVWPTPVSFADQTRGYVNAGLDRVIGWYLGDLNLTGAPLKYAFDTKQFKEAYTRIVRLWEVFRKEHDFPPFFYIPHDEIDAIAARTVQGKQYLQMFRDLGLQTGMTYIGLGDRRKETLHLVDIAIYAGDAFRAELGDESRAAGRKLWSYSGSATYGLDAKAERYFYGLFGVAIGADGVNQWVYQWPASSWAKDPAFGPYTPLSGGGTGYYFSYPTAEGVLPTIGFEGTREGIDDAKYIFTLRQWIARAHRSGNTQAVAAAQKAQVRLDDLLGWVDINRQNIQYLNMNIGWIEKHKYQNTCHKQPYAMVGADFDRFRRQWIQDILSIRSALDGGGSKLKTTDER